MDISGLTTKEHDALKEAGAARIKELNQIMQEQEDGGLLDEYLPIIRRMAQEQRAALISALTKLGV